MILLPEGTLRRQVFEACDRSLGWLFFSAFRPLSNICGDQIVVGNPCRFCLWMCRNLSRYVEKDHCLKNAGKP